MRFKGLIEGILTLLINGVAWFAGTEQLWFPMAATVYRYMGPIMDLPDLRGPFLFLTLCYLGLRLSDWIDKTDETNVDEVTL